VDIFEFLWAYPYTDQVTITHIESRKERPMKKRVAVTTMAMVLMAVMTATGQREYFSSLEAHQKTDLEKVACRYVQCFKTGNPGVIESALGHAVRMKLYVPEVKCPELRQEINSLAVMGTTPSIRYKAYLASLVFDSPKLFKEEAARQYKDPDDLFNTIASRLQVALLGSQHTKFVRPE
jgi:hypothetical protein